MRLDIRIELLVEAVLGCYVLGVVAVFWANPVSLVLMLGVSLVIQLWLWQDKAGGAAMVSAAVLGSSTEMLCVKLGVWTYYAPGLVLGIPFWLPLVWASSFCLFRRMSITAMFVTYRIWPEQGMFARRVFFGVLGGLIVVYYLVTACVILRTIALIYSVFVIPIIIFWHAERDILLFVIGGVLGTLGEYICMKLGIWQYHYPFFGSIGLPISLPLAWGVSAVIVGRISRIWEGGMNDHGNAAPVASARTT